MTANNAAFVGSVPENYDRYLGSVLFEPYADDLAGRLKVADGASVLELACGTGIVTRRLRDSLPPSVKLTATDLNDAMFNYAQQKFAPGEVEWRQADACELPFPDGSFEAIVCEFGIMFFPDKDRAAREVFRVLKPGGTFLFNVWDKIEENDFANIAHREIIRFFESDPPTFYEVPFSFFDHEAIAAMLASAGFRDIQVTTLPMTGVASSAADLTHGLIHGNPVAADIRERDESLLPQVESAIAEAIRTRCGDPPKGKLQAMVCAGVK